MRKILVLAAIAVLGVCSTSYAVVGLGVRAGMGSFGDGTSTSSFLFGAHVDLTALPMIGAEISGTFWSKSEEATVFSITTKTTTSIISVDGTAKYKFSIPGSPIAPYLGAGPGLYFTKGKAEITNYPTVETSETKFGIHGAGGVDFKIATMPLSIGAQVKYAAIFSDPGTHLLSVVGLVTYNY